MHRRAIAVEQAQLSQGIDPCRQATDHTPGAGQLLEGAGQPRSHRLRRLISKQKQLLTTFQAPRPRLARQTPSTFNGRLSLQEGQFIDDFGMNLLGNPQNLFGQRQGQGFGAGPDEKTDALGGHGVRSET
ncbi:hypothetical protein D3C76_1287790 [compost metagenome]